MGITTQGVDKVAVGGYLTDAIVVFVKHGSTDHDAMLDAIRIEHLSVRSNLDGIDVRPRIKAFVQQQRTGVKP